MSETMTKPVSEMTTDELEKMLAERKKNERSAQEKRERDYENRKDEFVQNTVAGFQRFHEQLKQFKQEVFEDGQQLHCKMYDVYGKEEKELKRFSLVSRDKKFKIEFERSDRQGFDETAEVAIAQIKEILRDKFEGRNKAMYKIIDDILSSNKAGDYDPRLVSKLRKHESDINDDKFSEALDILSDSYVVESTALYLRAYVRDDQKQNWKDVTLQFSSL